MYIITVQLASNSIWTDIHMYMYYICTYSSTVTVLGQTYMYMYMYYICTYSSTVTVLGQTYTCTCITYVHVHTVVQ